MAVAFLGKRTVVVGSFFELVILSKAVDVGKKHQKKTMFGVF